MARDVSWERRGLDMLLAEYPEANLLDITQNMPWLCIYLVDVEVRKFAIWRYTGCVYEGDGEGAVRDDPILIPEGSPYIRQSKD